MCDYSLEMYHSRPARAGERCVLHRFRSGSLGFVDPTDCETAVCMPAGARLRLEGISPRVQQTYSLGETAEVVMTRVPYSGKVHRDGVRVSDQRELLLQSFDPGVSAVLLPRDLEVVLDLKAGEATGRDRPEIAATPLPAHAVERFCRYLAPLRLRPFARRGSHARSTIDA